MPKLRVIKLERMRTANELSWMPFAVTFKLRVELRMKLRVRHRVSLMPANSPLWARLTIRGIPSGIPR